MEGNRRPKGLIFEKVEHEGARKWGKRFHFYTTLITNKPIFGFVRFG